MKGGPLMALWKAVVNGYDTVVDYSKFVLPITIFLFKFLEWWYETGSKAAEVQVVIPPPPDPPEVLQHCGIFSNSTACCWGNKHS